ncbi:TM0106 family RecB-like putative nuclease [Candidatus Bathyarchaeota archaeon]|nr:TM0106 family RecB-like putative nuclease [Candidatus Bathyarchaeota archaeon]
MVDTDSLVTTCLNSEGIDCFIYARLVYDYDIDPFKVWCEFHVSPDEKDPRDDFLEFLMEQGNDHESNTINEMIPDAEKVVSETPEEGFELVVKSMTGGIKAIANAPVFYMPEGLKGVIDLLERDDSNRSLFGDFHYTVSEIKLAKNIKSYHILQGAFYNYLVGKIQGYTPESFKIINRDREILEIPYNERELFNVLSEIRAIKEGKEVSPTYGSCDWPWETFANKEAIHRKDVSLINGVGKATKYKLCDVGIKSIDDVDAASHASLCSVKGIGEKTAIKMKNSAQAIISSNPVKIKDISLPDVGTEIFLDLEGTGEQIGEQDLISMDYLIGVTVRKNDEIKYIPFFADSLESEEKMFKEFLDWLVEQEDYIIYHWHHYERTHLSKLVEKHGTEYDVKSILFDKMIDLHKISVRSFSFPTYGTGLKEIAKYVGFDWRDSEINAMISAVIFLNYATTGNKEGLDRVIGYNEDDCNATMVIKDWLTSN